MKLKSFVSGVLVGAVVMSSVGVFAAQSQQVQAWLTDGLIINIDGNDMTLPADMHVINYDDRVYTPVRYIVEEMGGTVTYDADRQRVNIKTPAPQVIEPIPQPSATPEPAKDIKIYNELPVKYKQDEITLNIFGVDKDSYATVVNLDVINESARIVEIDYENAYIEASGKKYEATDDNNYEWKNTVGTSESVIDGDIYFEPMPKGEENIEIVIPVIYYDHYQSSDKDETLYTFNMNIDTESEGK